MGIIALLVTLIVFALTSLTPESIPNQYIAPGLLVLFVFFILLTPWKLLSTLFEDGSSLVHKPTSPRS